MSLDFEIPTIEDIIKKYETTPNNNAAVPSNNKASTKMPIADKIKLGLEICSSLTAGAMILGLFPILPVGIIVYDIKKGHIYDTICKHSDFNGSGTIDTDDEKKSANLILSDIAKSNNATYYSGRVRKNVTIPNYASGFYCGDENNDTCWIWEVEKWVDEYDLTHKGEEVQK